ncbi:hypothetical protein EDI_210310 [Entamoeba dispar SAW760]|uniref:Uncharacterized protein n=1 Tax=Entamoeba dispar (strain ATCC PRA-260 / SAW760) TaxID=370354 RepID=B0EUJ2_ENTDS|nr:uncharacterized protein EDI_210310 [Entamoeba dispar SAW760]EDR21798.1 hypothetical protein EDI_210310 [Entamoeba dispar SAW760]|eukprot:EDR21798.1 hypothetical protein EDI_210310 [Entamoeba dispar SAW760]
MIVSLYLFLLIPYFYFSILLFNFFFIFIFHFTLFFPKTLFIGNSFTILVMSFTGINVHPLYVLEGSCCLSVFIRNDEPIKKQKVIKNNTISSTLFYLIIDILFRMRPLIHYIIKQI